MSQPDQTIYVGDNYFADILGAANAGLRPVLLDPDGLFPEAACPVISSLGELLGVLGCAIIVIDIYTDIATTTA